LQSAKSDPRDGGDRLPAKDGRQEDGVRNEGSRSLLNDTSDPDSGINNTPRE
jgi:hypothetical protein